MIYILIILFGALTGWVAAILSGISSLRASVSYIIMGMIGALFGSLLIQAFATNDSTQNILGIFMAVFGAMVLIVGYKALDPGGK